MSVEFNEPPALLPRSTAPRQGGLLTFVMRTGLAKTPTQAKLILVIVAVLAVLASFMLLRSSSIAPPAPTSYDVIPR